MPHQNVDSSTATAQNAATDPVAPDRQTGGREDPARSEPRSYAASDAADSALAPPAAGEVADYMDEGDALEGELHSGANRTNIPMHSRDDGHHGPKTNRALREQQQRR